MPEKETNIFSDEITTTHKTKSYNLSTLVVRGWKNVKIKKLGKFKLN